MRLITKNTLDTGKYTLVRFEECEIGMVRELNGQTELLIELPKKLSTRTFRTMIRTAVRSARQHKYTKLAIMREALITPKTEALFPTTAELLRTVAENAVLANYEFSRYKTLKKDKPVLELVLVGSFTGSEKSALNRGIVVGTCVNDARDLANTPGGDMTPRSLADDARRLARGTSIAVRILEEREIKKLKMGALLGVSKGSKEEPRFIIMEYWGAGKSARGDAKHPIVLVGKGVTFDTGGVNLKPSDGILDMHLDMSGGAVVIASLVAIAKLGLKKNIIGLIPAAENMVSGESYRPGDVLTTLSGKTVDVLNTDAEGRLILADALTYAERYTPRLVVDVATLTGAALAAVGVHASIIMTKDEKLESLLRALGEASGDYVWPLPLWDEYKQYTKGVHGDISNIPSSGSKFGGAINGGMFLSHFTGTYPWVHIDMAPRMTSVSSDHLAKGATGEPVRLLVHLAEHY